MKFLRLMFLFFCFFPTLLFAEVSLIAQVDKAKAHAEEEIHFTLTLKFPSSLQLPLPDLAPYIQGFRVVDFGEEKSEREDNYVIKSRKVTLKADISGSYVLPAIKMNYEEKGEKKEVRTGEIFVEVVAESAESKDGKDGKKAQKDILDIKDIEKPTFGERYGSTLAGLAIFLSAALGFWWWKRRKKKMIMTKPLLPHEWAERELLLCLEMPLESDRELKAWAFRLSEILREYVERQFSFKATDMTLEEIKKQLSSLSQVNRDQSSMFFQLLKDLDFIKFANYKISVDEAQKKTQVASEFVALTRPQLESEKELVAKKTNQGVEEESFV